MLARVFSILAIVAFASRALIATGYMLAPDHAFASGPVVIACPSAGPLLLEDMTHRAHGAHGSGHHQAPHKHASEESCIFAAVAAVAAPNDLGAVAAPVSAAQFIETAPAPRHVLRRLVAPPPPATGPPISIA